MCLSSTSLKPTPAADIFLSCVCYHLSPCKSQDPLLCLKRTKLLDDGKVIGSEPVFIGKMSFNPHVYFWF